MLGFLRSRRTEIHGHICGAGSNREKLFTKTVEIDEPNRVPTIFQSSVPKSDAWNSASFDFMSLILWACNDKSGIHKSQKKTLTNRIDGNKNKP